jgi:hypothetical protein
MRKGFRLFAITHPPSIFSVSTHPINMVTDFMNKGLQHSNGADNLLPDIECLFRILSKAEDVYSIRV